jgi:2-iminoacetate synthase ThiH
MVSFDLSAENTPVDRTVKANTEATTTKAIRMIAVSRPVIPFSLRSRP